MKIKKNVKLNYSNKYFIVNFIKSLKGFELENKDFLKNYFEANHGD